MKPTNHGVSVYIRHNIEGKYRYEKAGPRTVYVPGTQFVLRYEHNGRRAWDKLPEGTNYALALVKAAEKQVALAQGVNAEANGQPKKAAVPAAGERLMLAQARDKYFENLYARGADPKTIRTYRLAVDPFVLHCGVTYVDETKPKVDPQTLQPIGDSQAMLTFMSWMRKQPVPKRKHGNPARTLSNLVGDVRIFLRAFGVTGLLMRGHAPKYHEKKVVAHTEDQLALLYSHADAEETFLLDYFIGTMVRDFEASGALYSDLTGTTLTVRGKQDKTRTVEISPRLAASIVARSKASDLELIFPNTKGEPDTHLLRTLQNLGKRAGAKFHTELHKLRKTGASRRYLADPAGLLTLMHELGHNTLEQTQRYLSDVRPPESKRAAAAADFIPKPRIVKTGTDGD